MERDDFSKGTSDFEAKSETLDYIYKDQLKELRELIIRDVDFGDIEICRRWFKFFSKTNHKEKLARNCLCMLMGQQIKENGYLTEPFTNFDNMKKDLECILKEIDEDVNTILSSETNDNCSNESKNTLHQSQSHIFCNDIYKDELITKNDPQLQHNYQQREEQLQCELKALRLQLSEKNKENKKLKEIAEKYCQEKEREDNYFDKIKKDILNGIRGKLVSMDQSGIRSQLHIFTDIFCNYNNDEEFVESLKVCDLEFHQILTNCFRKEFEKRKEVITERMLAQYDKSKLKLRQKYKNSLKLQEKFIKLSCFSTLRQICIECYREYEKMDIWSILHSLEQKYQNILNVT